MISGSQMVLDGVKKKKKKKASELKRDYMSFFFQRWNNILCFDK